ncbi:hypothetical protein KKH23_07235 [Patescibacteria group bacterium]|uniref:Uncharacterized protein n=1 Tax=viral metagenome TaxID=1070528 RepID=A0A6M3X4N4_9ZZZZ|nr:hypothetical protein [Patescibacteria group bacterium]
MQKLRKSIDEQQKAQSNSELAKALQVFQRQYPEINSGDLQTFILGWNAALITVREAVIKEP